MEEVATPFRSLAPTYPVPVELDYAVLLNATPPPQSEIKAIKIEV